MIRYEKPVNIVFIVLIPLYYSGTAWRKTGRTYFMDRFGDCVENAFLAAIWSGCIPPDLGSILIRGVY